MKKLFLKYKKDTKMGLCHSDTSNGTSNRILMLGLDSAGKTTLLYRSKLHQSVKTSPTIGFNVESVKLMNDLKVTIWDVGGQDKIRPLWRHYTEGTDGLLFVVDSTDRDRMPEAREELFRILERPEMKDVPLIVIANKQDVPNALNASEVTQQLNLFALRGRQWSVQPACATSGEGIDEGMQLLAVKVKEYIKRGRNAH